MVQNKKFPSLKGEFVKWVDEMVFIVSIDGKEILAVKDFWTGDIPAYKNDVKVGVNSNG